MIQKFEKMSETSRQQNGRTLGFPCVRPCLDPQHQVLPKPLCDRARSNPSAQLNVTQKQQMETIYNDKCIQYLTEIVPRYFSKRYRNGYFVCYQNSMKRAIERQRDRNGERYINTRKTLSFYQKHWNILKNQNHYRQWADKNKHLK